MQPVNSLNELGTQVMYFTGKTLDDSLLAAQSWAKTRGVTLQRYYVQKLDKKSIIADYVAG
jgi:hypothetical protein